MTRREKSPIQTLVEKVRAAKNSNVLLLLIWNEYMRLRGRWELWKYSDKKSVEKFYFKQAGRYPNLINPSLFSEKLQWLKLHYRDPLMSRCADKYEVRGYIAECGYEDLLNELIAVYTNVNEIDFEKLPEKFVLKATHGSNRNIVCGNKKALNWGLWQYVIKSWMNQNIFWNGREWVYRDIIPRLVCERFLADDSGGLIDYKLHCFNGNPAFVQVNVGRGTQKHVQNFYDLEWNILPFGKDQPHSPDAKIERPAMLAEMLDIAKALARPFIYVRVDLYNIGRRIVFGELTFFPASGMPDFVPAEYDEFVGGMLSLPVELSS